ncbi:MAG: uroporphyrinogen-III synthase [Gammaproteobacteria bacterium TMED112]|nr:MAG: uroporphyrinogen-III synthase [Gammaproteobacteria bacterium TMED112]|tara:strand:- start:34842 stop:35489 length:648 start_codon:yes stop_codon:yes gene_type:complete
MKIIDTKPFPAVHKYHEIVNIPLYKICKVKQIINLNNYRNIIFQSPSAVLNFEKINLLEERRIISMGPGTSKQLKKYGYVAETPDKEYSSEGVINLLNKTELSGRTLVIKGEGGLSSISKYLNSASLKTDELNTYNRQKFTNYTDIKKRFSGAGFVIFSSSLSVEIYFEHIYSGNETSKFLAVSNRVQDVIEKYKQESAVINYFSNNLINEIKLT